MAFNFKFFVSFVKARTNGTENQFEIDKKKEKMIKTDEAEKTNSPQSIFCFSHRYKRMKFKRKKKEKVAQHGHAYVYLYSACQIGTRQSTLNWSF